MPLPMELVPENVEGLDKGALVGLVHKLEEEVLAERRKSEAITRELKLAREQTLAVSAQVEQEEEFITNKLMKRLDELKREKQILATEVEQEEHFLANTLQKRLHALNREKVSLENRLKEEQRYIEKQLAAQLENLQSEKRKLNQEKIDLENVLEAEQEYIVHKLQKQIETLGHEKSSLQREKSGLQIQVNQAASAVSKLTRDKVELEMEMEMEEEQIVNRLQRQLEILMHNCRLLEAKLEAQGVPLRECGLTPLEPAVRSSLEAARSASMDHSASRSPSRSPSANSYVYAHMARAAAQGGTVPRGAHLAASFGSPHRTSEVRPVPAGTRAVS